MTHCARCDVDVQPVVDFHPGGRSVEQCPKCGGPVGEPQAKPKPAVSLETISTSPDRIVGSAPSRLPDNPIVALQARLRAVEALIPTPVQLRAARKEAAALRRALKALGVDPAPKAN